MSQRLNTAPWGSIIIPAHNEEAVLPRLLRVLSPLAQDGTVEVIVVPNGCTDRTAQIAHQAPGVRVVELGQGSKIAALNAGDAVASAFPRIFLDADIVVSPQTLEGIAQVLGTDRRPDGPLAGRPASEYDTSEAHFLVRANYRARHRALHDDGVHLWGAGLYALSQEGRARFDHFPQVAGDDYWIDQLFAPNEKALTPGPPVRVTAPLRPADLMAISARVYRGNSAVDATPELSAGAGHSVTTGNTLRRLLTSVRGPRSAFDAAVYTAFAVGGRLRARRTRTSQTTVTWERDNSSRSATSEGNHS